MTYTGLELFMENLKQLIYSNDNPLIITPSIRSERPQFQLLYEELDSMIQILYDGKHQDLHELKKDKYLKRRLKDAAEEAQDIIDLFVSGVHFRKKGQYLRPDIFKTTLNLDHVMRLVKSIKAEFMTTIMANMDMGSSQKPNRLQKQSAVEAETSCTRNPLGRKKLLEEIVVGLEYDTDAIVEKLIEDQEQLDIVSIVGMGGIGKTTLATKVFNHCFVLYHFYVRAWVTVSQTYEKRDVLTQILASLGVQVDLEAASDSTLREILHKTLTGKRYLIVIDDIWSKEAWDNLKVLFPYENTRSRILLTSRLNEVALHAKPNGFVHLLSYLTENQSWELLCKKVFHGKERPKWLVKHGVQIAKKCHGLPLAVVVIAGLLAKEPTNKDLWKKVAHSVNSLLASDQNGHMETLALSYNHLPLHLKECFLYLGGFPEDFKFPAHRLIWLWVAEGFIQEAENQSFEDVAESCLMDLVARNLVIVTEKKCNGSVKAFKVHDLVRELCVKKAEEERFLLKVNMTEHSDVSTTYKLRRLFTYQDIYIVKYAHTPTPSIRSLFCFQKSTSLFKDITDCFRSFVLLRVLDLQKCEFFDFPEGITLLVHLRYLAIQDVSFFPSSICNLRSLQTLIVNTRHGSLDLPCNISDLVNLRHFSSNKDLYLPSIEKPMNLRTISNVELGDSVENIHKCFPIIKKLSLILSSNVENDFELLPYLYAFKVTGFLKSKPAEPDFPKCEPNFGNHKIRFPTTLKKLSLARCRLPWSCMSIIQLLPNLEVLKLSDNAFEGTMWKTDEAEFRQLKFLRLEMLNIKKWEAHSINFPCLKQLQLMKCYDLIAIPLEIGDCPSLERIQIGGCSTGTWNKSVYESMKRIQEEQNAVGNYELQLQFKYNDGILYPFNYVGSSSSEE